MSYRSSALILFYTYLAMHLHSVLSSVSERIIGGTNADITSVPYVLSFRINDEHACGAAIINTDCAVTAAHCVEAAAKSAKRMSVCSGMSDLCENCIVHDVINFFIHENYSDLDNDYDIAVIQVFPPFTFNNRTKAVDLASGNARKIFTKYGMVCGWGNYMKINGRIDSEVSQNLQCIEIPLIDKKLCQKDYKYRFTITPRMTCYGFQDGSKDTCKGDSGGPLVNKDNILLGITSWGDGCAQKYSPGVYTNALCFHDWIKAKTGSA